MCKQLGRSFCSELGVDSSLWSKDTPLEKPEWIKETFQTFSKSIQLTLEGQLDAAKSLLKEAPDLEMRDWFHVHGQNSGFWRNKAFGIPAPAPITPRDATREFAKFEPSVFARDNFRCRYCSCEVLPKKEFEKVNSALGSDALPLGGTNANRSGFLLMFSATLDHVLPFSLGGKTDETNLVTCCWSCNYGKSNFTVEQLGIRDPRVS